MTAKEIIAKYTLLLGSFEKQMSLIVDTTLAGIKNNIDSEMELLGDLPLYNQIRRYTDKTDDMARLYTDIKDTYEAYVDELVGEIKELQESLKEEETKPSKKIGKPAELTKGEQKIFDVYNKLISEKGFVVLTDIIKELNPPTKGAEVNIRKRIDNLIKKVPQLMPNLQKREYSS